MGVLYASGHVPQSGLTSTDGDAILSKPYRPEDVVRALSPTWNLHSERGHLGEKNGLLKWLMDRISGHFDRTMAESAGCDAECWVRRDRR